MVVAQGFREILKWRSRCRPLIIIDPMPLYHNEENLLYTVNSSLDCRYIAIGESLDDGAVGKIINEHRLNGGSYKAGYRQSHGRIS